MKRIVDVIEYNKNALNRVLGMSVIERRAHYEKEKEKENNEYIRANQVNMNVCEATAFTKQFSELEKAIHCILKYETISTKIEKEDASLVVPKNFIVEPMKVFSEFEKEEKKEPRVERHVGKIKRSSYVAFLN